MAGFYGINGIVAGLSGSSSGLAREADALRAAIDASKKSRRARESASDDVSRKSNEKSEAAK
jgi:hypothetical protein